MILALILLTCYGFATVHGHDIRFFKLCPIVDGMKSLDVEKFLGKWYIIEVLSSINKCMTMDFQRINDITLKVTQQREFVILNKMKIDHKNSYTGEITIRNPDTPSEMEVKWAANPMKMNFIVVDTDYDNYAVIFECQNLFIVSRLSLAILSRKRGLEDSPMEKARKAINGTQVETSTLTVVEHSTCISDNETMFTGRIDESLFSLRESERSEEIVKLGE